MKQNAYIIINDYHHYNNNSFTDTTLPTLPTPS